MSKADKKHEQLQDLIADINTDNAVLHISEYHESNIYTVTVTGKGRHQPSIIGDINEAIAFARGVKAALEVL